MVNVKSLGNTAKMYCLQKIGELAARGSPLVLLDMGCGTGKNFPQFLDAYPNVRYVGADPHRPSIDEARKVLAGKNAELHFAPGDGFVLEGGADVIVSFSVFEHVPIARRAAYVQAVRANLKPGGIAFINYDAGHFTTETTTRPHATAWMAMRQAVIQFVRNQLVERFGANVYYQRFAPETSFVRYCADAGLRILETKSFNTGLKRVFRSVKPEAREEFMRRWLDLELWVDANTVPYNDDLAAVFTTRCHVLSRGNA
jgi:SAM-dependent methyltransferase